MTHHCGLVIENVLQKDQGTWKCNMKLMDEKSKIYTIDKVIDLNVRDRKKERRKGMVIHSASMMMVMETYMALRTVLVTVMEMEYQEVYHTNKIMLL